MRPLMRIGVFLATALLLGPGSVIVAMRTIGR